MLGVFVVVYLFQHRPSSPVRSQSNPSKDAAKERSAAVGLSRGSNLRRADSVQSLISRFSGPTPYSLSSSTLSLYSGPRRVIRSVSMEALHTPKPKLSLFTPSSSRRVVSDSAPPSREDEQKAVKPSKITARIDCPVEGSAQKTASAAPNKAESGRDSMADSGMGSVRDEGSNRIRSDDPLPIKESRRPFWLMMSRRRGRQLYQTLICKI